MSAGGDGGGSGEDVTIVPACGFPRRTEGLSPLLLLQETRRLFVRFLVDPNNSSNAASSSPGSPGELLWGSLSGVPSFENWGGVASSSGSASESSMISLWREVGACSLTRFEVRAVGTGVAYAKSSWSINSTSWDALDEAGVCERKNRGVDANCGPALRREEALKGVWMNFSYGIVTNGGEDAYCYRGHLGQASGGELRDSMSGRVGKLRS